MNQTFSIIVPAYNEAERLPQSLETIIRYLETQKLYGELILVDDGSSDNTAEIAHQCFSRMKSNIPAKVVRYDQNHGKGYAARSGLSAASGDIALFSDADLSTPISEMEKLLGPIRSGEADVTFGSRALDRSLIGTHQPWRREQGGRVFNLIVRMFTGLPFWDTQCGFKAFRMKLFRPILEVSKIDRFGFDVELLLIAHHAGLRLREVPVKWDHNDGSKVSVISDSVRMFNEVLEIRRNTRRGVYQSAFDEIERTRRLPLQRSFAASA